MKCKFVYTLISNGDDNYTEQMAVSVFSLKYYNTSAEVILVTDQRTIDDIHLHKMDDLLRDIDEVVIAETNSSYNGMQRSRQLKTSVRDLVDGDILFVDTDTIITGSLESVNAFDNMVIGAVYDLHRRKTPTNFNNKVKDVMKAMAWNKEILKDYFNSGVIYIKDCKETHDFYKRWNDNWIKTKNLGFNYDQLSFAFTNIEFDNIIKPLPFYYNTQVNTSSLLLISNALILHLFYGSNKSKKIVNILSKFGDELYLRVKQQKYLSEFDKIQIVEWKTLLYPEIERQSEIDGKILYILFKACLLGDFKHTFNTYVNKVVRRIFKRR